MTVAGSSAGAAWVERFLLPLLARRFKNRRDLACLQLWPDDATEADRLRELGYRCTMAEPTPAMALASPDGSYDFAFTGRFSRGATEHASRMALAREFHRVLRSGGSLLLAAGNRACPVDLTRNGPVVHGRSARSCLSLDEFEDLFRQAGFDAVEPLGVAGHFGWGSLHPLVRPLGSVLDAYWRAVVTPSRRWLYAGPLNPALLVWLTKN